jgi:uncharacterized protein (DUF983 family)
MARRDWVLALGRGLRKRCPACGRGSLFQGYAATAARCAACGLDIGGHQADDAPPYVTAFVVGHLVIPLVLLARQAFDLSVTAQFLLWTPLAIAATAWFLPVSKGALIAIQWANRMHGFGEGAVLDSP